MPKRFVTLVPHIENLELRKDTGQIPYQFYKTLGYEALLVSYFYTLAGGRKEGPLPEPPVASAEITANYPYLKSEVPGLKMRFLPNLGRKNFYEKSILNYLKSEAKHIDILNLFHLGSENIFYALYYKFKNPRGKLYIKLDIDIKHYEQQKHLFNVSGKLGALKNIFYSTIILPLFFRTVNLFSAESSEGLTYFKKRFSVSPEKLLLLPNGVDQERISSLVPAVKTLEEKDNIILTAGRIGSPQKYHELLIKAAASINLKGWKVYFAGPLEAGFDAVISEFYDQYPHLKDVVIFTGAITDPQFLLDLYNRSKIFCMPSRWEGFPNAAVEAAFFGNLLLLSDQIFAYNTLTNYGAGGDSFGIENENELCALLKKYITNPNLILNKHLKIAEYAREHFDWSKIVKKIDQHLN